MASGLDKLVAPGRHMRRPGRAGLRRVCVAALIMLVLQYGLGIFLNLYVAVPASDAHAGIFAEIATAPLALTVHALLGLALIGTAILLVARAVGVRDRLLAVLASAGLTAIGGAFGAGEIFVRNGQSTASMAMAILTGVALLCYVGTLALASTAQQEVRDEGQRQGWGQGPRQAVRPRPAPAIPAQSRARTAYPAAGPVTPAAGFRPTAGFPAGEGWPNTRPGRSPDSWFARE
jgi:hypothetical protein